MNFAHSELPGVNHDVWALVTFAKLNVTGKRHDFNFLFINILQICNDVMTFYVKKLVIHAGGLRKMRQFIFNAFVRVYGEIEMVKRHVTNVMAYSGKGGAA